MNVPAIGGVPLTDYSVSLNETFLDDVDVDPTSLTITRTSYGAMLTDPMGGKVYITGSEILALAYMCGQLVDRAMVARRYPKCIDRLDAIRFAGRPE